MKLRALFVWLVAAFTGLGAPPADVTGMKFRHSTPGSGFKAIAIEVLLNGDGNYTGLRTFDWRERQVGATRAPVLEDVSIPDDGRWTYRVVDASTAEIRLDGTALTLHFLQPLAGRVGAPNFQGLNRLFLFEAYNTATRLANCSTRSFVAAGRSVSLGFVISEGERRVLVRAVGPGLRVFGITEALPNPVLTVTAAGNRLPVDFALPSSSQVTLENAARRSGAFPLPTAHDRGKYLTLQAGAYIAEVVAADRTATGEVLLEVYQLP